MNEHIVQVAVDEANEILHNAREAVLSGEISEQQYNEIKDSCYRACMEALAERREELGYLGVKR